jgi:hypothetical protein
MSERDRRKLQREREKLNRLVDEALENGTPISQAYDIVEQSKKFQRLLSENGERDRESE